MSRPLEHEWSIRRTRVFPSAREQTPWRAFIRNLYIQNVHLDRKANFFVKLHNGIGDQVCVLGLLEACRDYYRPDNIILLARETSRDLLSMFRGAFDNVIFFSEFPDFAPADSGEVFDVLHMPSKAHLLNGKLNPWFNKLCVPYLDQYRIGLGLPPDATFCPPSLPSGELVAREVAAISESTKGSVVLFPYSNTWPGPSVDFWLRLAETLRARGITVFSNVKNVVNNTGFLDRSRATNHECLPGTLPLDCSLVSLIGAAPGWRGWVAGVSGPSFLLPGKAPAGVIVHENKYIRFGEHCVRSLIEIDGVKQSFPSCDELFDIEIEEDPSGAVQQVVAHITDRSVWHAL